MVHIYDTDSQREIVYTAHTRDKRTVKYPRQVAIKRIMEDVSMDRGITYGHTSRLTGQ